MKMSTEHRKLPGRALLRELLSERNQYPERGEEIDERIRSHFERQVTVLVLDMVGFSSLSQKLGIISYLAMIAEMYMAARPAIVGNGGKVIKVDADNVFAIFDSPHHALEASIDIQRAFVAVNGVVPDERDLYGSIGIGHGPTLVIDDEDFFSCEVNLASKLGEDIAGASEILLTQSAFETLKPGCYCFDAHRDVIGGHTQDYYRFRACLDPEGNELEPLPTRPRARG